MQLISLILATLAMARTRAILIDLNEAEITQLNAKNGQKFCLVASDKAQRTAIVSNKRCVNCVGATEIGIRQNEERGLKKFSGAGNTLFEGPCRRKKANEQKQKVVLSNVNLIVD